MSSRTSTPSLVRPLVVALAMLTLVLGLGACSSSGSGGPQSSSGATTSGGDCGVRKVGEVQVRTFCGEGAASAVGGKANVSLTKAACETSADYLAVNAGTIVLGADAAAKKVQATTQYIGLVVGQVPGDTTGTPAPKDGTYTGALLTVNDKGTALLPEAKSLKVILVSNRTSGTFTGPLVGGGTVTGTFKCGA